MKQIDITLRYSFDFKTDFDKIVAMIIYLETEKEIVNKSNIKYQLVRCSALTGFVEDIEFLVAIRDTGNMKFDYLEEDEQIKIVSSAIKHYNKIYKQDLKIEDLEF